MSPSRPFFISDSGELDTEQLIDEAVPLAKLIGAVGTVAVALLFLRFVFVGVLGFIPGVEILFTLVIQFVLAVGTGLVLIYIIVRSNDLHNE